MQSLRTVVSQISTTGAPAAYPASYIAFFDVLADPMKIAGFIVLVLQGVYVGVKIWKELRGKNGAPQNG